MKNLFLVAAILAAGITSAKTTPVKSLNIKKQKASKQIKLSAKPPQSTFVVYTSCGVAATTTQNWTAAQGQIWKDMIEANYCGNGY